MTNKILKSILSVAVVVLLASLVIVTGVLYQHFGHVQEAQLKTELDLAAGATELLGEAYLEKLDSENYRLTWVDPEGVVLYDTHVDYTTMENHGDREEILEAVSEGTGSSKRYSFTLTEQTLYEAVRLEDGSVLRASISHATALALVLDMLYPIFVVLLLALLLSIWLAHRMAKRVVEPLNTLNLEDPMENTVYEELSPLLSRIHALHEEIAAQMLVLQQKQDEFEQITGNMNEALIMLDDKGMIVSINPAAKKLFRVGADCVGKDFLLIDEKPEMHQAIKKANEKGQSYFRIKKNGKEYQFELSRIDSDGNVHGLVILAFDITEQVNAEKHRQEFTANVSHELKTPLQSIIGAAELMENGIVKEEDLPRFMGHIHKEASRLLNLINDIIRLSQLDEGIEMPREEVSLLGLAEEICDTLQDEAMRKGISLEVKGDAGRISGVRRLLFELIYNLCDNGIKYNHAGGYVKIEITEKAEGVELCVCDNGIGIAAEQQDKIFERFYRVDKSHSKQSGGTGLGLSIVKHAVQYHHGEIKVESGLGKGTQISVLFTA